jgi:hypothetical protein
VNILILLASAAIAADPFPISSDSPLIDSIPFVEIVPRDDSLMRLTIRAQDSGTSTFGGPTNFWDSAKQSFGFGSNEAHTYDPGAGSTAVLPECESGTMPVPALSFGTVGPQPYRFGWTSRYDVAFLPQEGVSGGGAYGNFGVFEFNMAGRYTMGPPNGISNLIFSITPEFNYRSWSGPTFPNLPANVFRFASDFELATPANYPVSLQLGFTPAFVSDFSANPTSDAWNYDARGAVFIRTSPHWMVALGAAYWHRVDDIVIPYAGVVWTPNDIWELRLMFPKSRISYFVGNWWGSAAWVYGSLEYGVEAYEINLQGPLGGPEKIQLSDYRALFGLRAEGGGVTGFVEGGWVFDRQVDFLYGTPGFDINTGFIARLGLRF